MMLATKGVLKKFVEDSRILALTQVSQRILQECLARDFSLLTFINKGQTMRLFRSLKAYFSRYSYTYNMNSYRIGQSFGRGTRVQTGIMWFSVIYRQTILPVSFSSSDRPS